MNVNVELLRTELEFITANPERWEQRELAVRKEGCGTACCVAGWTALHAGHEPQWRMTVPWADKTTDGTSIWDLARELLGLTESEADLLFDGYNKLVDLWEIAAEITDGAIKVPASMYGEVGS